MNPLQDYRVRRIARMASLALLACLALASCRTNDYMLARLRDWSVAMPPHLISSEQEHQTEKAAMSEWLESHLGREYHVIYAEFVWLEPGHADEQAMGDRAGQFVEHTLKATPQSDVRLDDAYRLRLWKQEIGVNGTPTLIAFVVASAPAPDMKGRRLAGFLELIPSDQLPPIYICCYR